MILVYVRHAIAMEREEFAAYCLKRGLEPDDEMRPLTKDGIVKMERGARGLKRALKSLDLVSAPMIVSSPLVRAKATAEIIKSSLGTKQKLMTTDRLAPGQKPERNPEAFRNWLFDQTHSGASHRVSAQTAVIIVGHEPDLSAHISWWISTEAKSRFPFKKGGATCVEIGGGLAPGQGRLLWALPPWALRALARAD